MTFLSSRKQEGARAGQHVMLVEKKQTTTLLIWVVMMKAWQEDIPVPSC